MPRSKSRSTNDLLREYRKLAKRADQRLVRLEKLSQTKNFKQVKQWAYKNAATDAIHWGANPEKPRFNIAPPRTEKGNINTTQLKAKIQDMKNFLEKPTSTKAGIVNIYQKKADTLNEKYKKWGLDLNWSDVGDFFESKLYKKLAKSMGSGTRIKAIATIKENEEEILKNFAQHKASHIKTEDNDIVVDEAIKRMLQYYKSDVRNLLNQI